MSPNYLAHELVEVLIYVWSGLWSNTKGILLRPPTAVPAAISVDQILVEFTSSPCFSVS